LVMILKKSLLRSRMRVARIVRGCLRMVSCTDQAVELGDAAEVMDASSEWEEIRSHGDRS